MMALHSIHDVFEEGLKDIFNAETQLTKALPKMAKAAGSAELRELFQNHLEETRGQIERLNQVAEAMGIKLRGKKCLAMEGLIAEGQETIEEEGEDVAKDNALIGAAQKVEHYEIAAYGTLRTLAQKLGQEDSAELLQQTLDEEKAADERLTDCAESLQESTEEAGAWGEAEETLDAAEEEGVSDEGAEAEPATRARGRTAIHGRQQGAGSDRTLQGGGDRSQKGIKSSGRTTKSGGKSGGSRGRH